MDPIRIGLMGFGRIGRSLFRILYARDDVRVAAISDVADPEALEYLVRFDTILGRFPEELSVKEGQLFVRGRRIPMFTGRDAADRIDWGELGIDVLVAATGREWSRTELEAHLERGAGRIVLCQPTSDPPDLTVVMGVNDHLLGPQHRIVSNGSCTAHSAAPVLEILSDAFGIERAFLTTVHAYTNEQRLADVPAEDPRRGRAAAENIIPQDTNAAHVIMELLPQLAGKLSGKAVNVPVPNGSVVDLVCWHRDPVSVTAVNEVVRTAAASLWQGILDYEDEPIVSSDILHSPYSGTFDAEATMVLGERVSKTLTWFDNSWGYAHRVVDLIRRLESLDEEAA